MLKKINSFPSFFKDSLNNPRINEETLTQFFKYYSGRSHWIDIKEVNDKHINGKGRMSSQPSQENWAMERKDSSDQSHCNGATAKKTCHHFQVRISLKARKYIVEGLRTQCWGLFSSIYTSASDVTLLDSKITVDCELTCNARQQRSVFNRRDPLGIKWNCMVSRQK